MLSLLQVYNFLTNLLRHLCSWILAMLVLEITLILVRPKQAHLICVTERVKNISLFILLLLICVNAHYFWTYGLVQPYPSSELIFCSFTSFGGDTSKSFRKGVWQSMDLVFSAFLPNALTFGCLLFLAVKRCCYRVDMFTTIEKNHFIMDHQCLKNLSTATLVLAISNLVFTLPEISYNFFEFAMEKFIMQSTYYTTKEFAQKALAQQLCCVIRDCYLSLKIVIYISCLKTFRNKCWALVTFRSCRIYHNKRKQEWKEYYERVLPAPDRAENMQV